MFARLRKKLRYLHDLLTEPETADEMLAHAYEDRVRKGQIINGSPHEVLDLEKFYRKKQVQTNLRGQSADYIIVDEFSGSPKVIDLRKKKEASGE